MRMTLGLSRSTSGSWASCVAIFAINLAVCMALEREARSPLVLSRNDAATSVVRVTERGSLKVLYLTIATPSGTIAVVQWREK